VGILSCKEPQEGTAANGKCAMLVFVESKEPRDLVDGRARGKLLSRLPDVNAYADEQRNIDRESTF
jgi:hypothetical protein